MKKYYLTIAGVLVFFCLITLLSTNVIAGPGRGYGRGMGYNSQGAYGQPMGPGPYPGKPGMNYRGQQGGVYYRSNLSDEQIKQMEQKRKTFFDATSDLRAQIQSKRMALGSELAKSEPDAAQTSKLQQELSKLNAELAQKRIEHTLEMKKIDPNIGMGYAGRYGHMNFGPHGGTRGRAW